MDEKRLIKKAIKGKASAQQMLFERYSPKMLSVCLRYTGNRFEADDVLVMAFTRVFDKLNTYKHEGSFEGWVRRIVVNEALGYLRKHRKHHFEEIGEAENAGMYVAPSSHLEAEALHNLVRQLPEGYRTVFNLYAIEGFSHKEIAERLEISVGTSKSQLNRARTLLKTQLAKLEKDEY
ncbi:MAG: sigma-70 family RNA polymerase sigma factor [Bacteroidota bacterium]